MLEIKRADIIAANMFVSALSSETTEALKAMVLAILKAKTRAPPLNSRAGLLFAAITGADPIIHSLEEAETAYQRIVKFWTNEEHGRFIERRR